MATLKKPKTVHWTNHARAKMRFYRLSEQRVKAVIHSPGRIEKGIAPNTIAFMQRAGSKKHPYEIWTMAQDDKLSRKIISAWRYPGITKPGEPLPDAIRQEIDEVL